MEEATIVRHLVMSGWAPQSINAVRPKIHRWIRQLAQFTDWRAGMMLELLMLQAGLRTNVIEGRAHHLRNVLGLREWHI